YDVKQVLNVSMAHGVAPPALGLYTFEYPRFRASARSDARRALHRWANLRARLGGARTMARAVDYPWLARRNNRTLSNLAEATIYLTISLLTYIHYSIILMLRPGGGFDRSLKKSSWQLAIHGTPGPSASQSEPTRNYQQFGAQKPERRDSTGRSPAG